MSCGANMKMQEDHGENSNNNRLTAHRMEELLKEDHEARRQQRRCLNLVRFIGFSFLMAGIAYCIYDINSIKSSYPSSKNTCPSPTPCPSLVSQNCPACSTPIPCPPVPRISQTCPSPSPCPSTALKTCPSCPSVKAPNRALQIMAEKLFGNAFDSIKIFKNSLYLLRKLPTNHTEARVRTYFITILLLKIKHMFCRLFVRARV